MIISNRESFLESCKAKCINTMIADALIEWLEKFEYRSVIKTEIAIDQNRYLYWGIDEDIEDFFSLLSLDEKYSWNNQEVLGLSTIGDVLLFATHHLLKTP